MTKLKEFYKGDMPCNDCVHNNVCNVKKCFEETKFETTHPFVDIQVRCLEYRHCEVLVKKKEWMKTSCIESVLTLMIEPQESEDKE